MTVSGFTIIRNGVKYSYPFKEAILSILPLCDEFVVNVGDSEDGTLDEIQSIKSGKLKIINRKWDMSQRENGLLLSTETNYALKECSGDWCFYIQSDEVLHEKYIPTVRAAMEEYVNDVRVEGLRFRYKHFYGSYDYFQDNYRKWYVREVRVIKNRRSIVSWADAMGFMHADGRMIAAVNIKAEIYHYGYVRPPETLAQKRVDFHKLYHDDDEVKRFAESMTTYDDLGNLKKFHDTHPAVMQERVRISNWNFDAKLGDQPPDWVRAIMIFLYPVTKRLKKFLRVSPAKRKS